MTIGPNIAKQEKTVQSRSHCFGFNFTDLSMHARLENGTIPIGISEFICIFTKLYVNIFHIIKNYFHIFHFKGILEKFALNLIESKSLVAYGATSIFTEVLNLIMLLISVKWRFHRFSN